MTKNDLFEINELKAEDMAISLENILPSLAKALYGEDWRISIRELLQNCHDALVERQARKLGTEEDFPKIEILPNPDDGTLTFKDNGIGMTEVDVKNHLATVGAGYKSKQIVKLIDEEKCDRHALDSLIGQYGIGFLSSFIIADKVVVRTRNYAKSSSVGIRAIFTGETRWYHEEDPKADFGTEVILKLKTTPINDPQSGKTITIHDLLNFERLSAEVRRFGDLLPFTILVHRGSYDTSGEPCNAIKGPWEDAQVNVQKITDFLTNRHPKDNKPITAYPFQISKTSAGVDANGIIYFPRPDHEINHPKEGISKVELFCRRMFITNDISSLLPDWTNFVGVVVECKDLSPTLSRNDVIRYDPPFIALKKHLGIKVCEILKHIADTKPREFDAILNEHEDRLYTALLLEYKDVKRGEEIFFKAVIPHIPFTVIHRGAPAGESKTLPAYRATYSRLISNPKAKHQPEKSNKSSPSKDKIYFLSTEHSLGQYKAMIIQRDIPVILTTRLTHQHLLKCYGEIYADEVTINDVTDILDLYVQEVDQKPYEVMREFLNSLDGGGPDESRASRFEPNYVPAIVATSRGHNPEKADNLQRLLNEGGNVLDGKVRRVIEDEIAGYKAGKEYVTVLLNENNPIIRTIRDYCTAGNPLEGILADVLHEVYHMARSYKDPRLAESDHYFSHKNSLLIKLLEKEQDFIKLQNEYDRTVVESKSLENKLSEISNSLVGSKTLQQRNCVLLLTDLIGSTRMVGFLDGAQSAAILQKYAKEIKDVIETHGGNVEKFTGDGIFAYFDQSSGSVEKAASAASACAFKILGTTKNYFNVGDVRNTLLASGGIHIEGARTILHYGQVMTGEIAGSSTLIGKSVVSIFRACNNKDLFTEYSIIMTEPFYMSLGLGKPIKPFKEDVRFDGDLPPLSFYPHPSLVKTRK